MNTRIYGWMAAGVLALAVPGAALAAGGIGTLPPGGFSIDDPAFDPANVIATPCPAGSTCIELTGSGGDMLQREVTVTDTGERYVQTIVAQAGAGEFANESRMFATGVNNTIAAKLRIEDPGLVPEDAFMTEHTFYRGNFDVNGGFPAIELVQTIGGDFQTMTMELPNIPNNGANMNLGAISIDQGTDDAAGVFAHRVLRGAGYAPSTFNLSITDGDGVTQTLARTGSTPGGLTATYIGANMPGGGIGIGDDERQFGVLIYRFFSANAADGAVTVNNTTTGGPATEEIRGISQRTSNSDSGMMAGDAHGAFVNGDAVSMGWDETLFGPAPL